MLEKRMCSQFQTTQGSINVSQIETIDPNTPISDIFPKEAKKRLNGHVVLSFPATAKEDGFTTIIVTNRETGEQIYIKL